MTNLIGESTDGVPAVKGVNTDGGIGVHGVATTNHGVHGDSTSGRGVVGISKSFFGVFGHSDTFTGVGGESATSAGVAGKGGPGQPGVVGDSDGGDGVLGRGRRGVVGVSNEFQGVAGESTQNAGVVGLSHSNNNAGVFADNDNGGFGVIALSEKGTSGIGIFAKGSRVAARFEGDVEVAKGGDIRLENGDCAEDFDIADPHSAESGTVMVVSEEGALRESRQAYDKRVAGVISGAGSYRPAIVLDKQQSESNRQPVALLGKVYCKVDAQYGAVEVGDLLTTSTTPGYAMRTEDPLKAFGAVIGKALRPLKEGRGLIPILIALQ
jgi:hypothetical protein